MATPKTPRKRAEKAEKPIETPEETVNSGFSPDSSAAEIMDAETVETPDAPVSDVKTDAEAAATSVQDVTDLSAATLTDTADTAKSEPDDRDPFSEEHAPEPRQDAPASEYEPEAQTAAAPLPKLEAAREIEGSAATRSGSVFVPMVLGGIVAAGIGFGLARFVVPEGWPMAGPAPLMLQSEENAKDITDLKARLDALTKAGADDRLAGDLALLGTTAANALETANNAQHAVDALEPRLTALEAGLADLANRPSGDATIDAQVIDSLTADIQTMRAEVDAQKAAADAAAAELAQAVEIARAEAEAKAQSSLLQAAAAQIAAALQSGVAFAEPAAQLTAAGVDLPAPLGDLAADGAPTIAALKDAFEAPARLALDASRRANMGQSMGERIGSFLKTQTGARSLTPQEGDDADAVLSRAEDALRKGDLPAALALIAALPEPARPAMTEWVALANLRLAALDAASKLTTAMGER